MKDISGIRRASSEKTGEEWWLFYCPGCQHNHSFRTSRGTETSGPQWTFNGDTYSPTFSPSLVYEAKDGRPRCHLFLRDGRIEFLSDCSHKLAGSTVPLPPWPY